MITKKSNEPIIINKNFNKCILYISFPIDNASDLELKILKKLIFKTSKVFNTEKKVYETKIKNNCVIFTYNIETICESKFLNIILVYPSRNAIKKDVLKDNLLFLKDIIYNPILKDDLFDSKEIEEIKEIYKKTVKEVFDDSRFYYEYQNKKLLQEDDYFTDDFIEDNKIIDQITPLKLTKLYKNIINNNPFIFLIGDVNDTDKKTIEEIFLNNKINQVKLNKKYNHFFKEIPKTITIKKEHTNYSTSVVFYNYKLVNPTDKDKSYLLTIRNLLNSNASMLLFDKLRLENNLVYRCGVNCYVNVLTLTIWATCGKNNIDKVKETIEETMNILKAKDFIDKYLDKAKEKIRISNILSKESLESLLNEEIDKFIEYKKHTYYEELKKITNEDMYNFINNKLALTSIYIGEGKDE